VEIKVKKLNTEAILPSYAHPGDVGLDVRSTETVTVPPGGHHIFDLGFALEFPEGFAAIMADKGSISKSGLHVMGGVFDAGYRGEYNVHLVNLSTEPYTVEKGDKVAQIIMYVVAIAKISEATELSDTSRGEGRFGSTGK
jgi:dUTP pyrophosphatase